MTLVDVASYGATHLDIPGNDNIPGLEVCRQNLLCPKDVEFDSSFLRLVLYREFAFPIYPISSVSAISEALTSASCATRRTEICHESRNFYQWICYEFLRG